ncbi:DUF3857 domain-containing protein [Hyunsoonleella ulvae]|uniref:DUF3857 domain-containing protein n=1 Tax=Hyunsoonleella ulvae TaxID=2799948 RepID=UPI001EF03324|nr:transglutaminase domain-containing protein [Hyunsoonleella ulvae]
MRILWCLLLGFSLTCLAQESEEFKRYKTLYPNATAVTLNKETTITIKLNNENIDITQEHFEEDLYLDEGASRNAKRSLHFSSFFELEDVKASSFVFSDGKYREMEVKEFSEKDELDQSFHDDSKSLNFIFPNLQKGSKSRLKYSENVKNPRFLSPFYFGDFSPIVNNKITIVADKNITLKFKAFQTEDLDIKFNKQEKRNTTIYTWELKNMDKFKYEYNSPTYKKIFPHIVPIITSYKANNNTIALANKVDDLYQWYYSLVKDINKDEPNQELIKVVENLTADKTNDFEKVKAIYYWTQKNIKYIAFEYALGGFIPRQANDVFNKKYGDCKDNSSILFKMLEIAGIEGDLTWIGTRKIPYSYDEVPTPIVDNHMILSYTDAADNTYFLDATGRFIPIDYPTPFIQGKEALISKGASGFVIKKVPVVPAAKNAVIDTTIVNLEGENLIGTSKVEICGYRKLDCFDALEYANTAEKLKTFYIKQLEKGNNRFIIENFTETNKFHYDKNLIVDYNFNLNGYAKKLGDEIYVNLNLNKELSPYKMDDDRKNDLEYDYKSYFDYTTTLNIPEGYTVDYIPENVSVSNNLISTSISYTVSENTVIYKHDVTFNFINLTLEEQKEVDKVVKTIEKAYKEVIILKKL